MATAAVLSPEKSAPTREASILVVAEHAIVRTGLRVVLDSTPGLRVVGEAADPGEAVEVAGQVGPDVVLLEPPRGADVPLTELRALRAAAPQACLVYLARNAPIGAGELRCLPPDSDVVELCFQLGSVLGDRCAACLLRPQCVAPRIAVALSPRERQVAAHVARGMSSKQIAALLGIKLRTVNTYRESLARKIGASSPAVVTRYVLEHGLIGAD